MQTNGLPRRARRIVIPGGSGFLGQALAAHLTAGGDEVVVLSRGAAVASHAGVRIDHWDGESLGPWVDALDGADAIVNLAGRSVDCRYGERNKREILDSRVRSTRVLGEAIGCVATPPPVWLNASTATVYRHAEDRPMDEATGTYGSDFSPDVCLRWEEALAAARTPRTRKVALRTAVVLGHFEAFAILHRLTRLGLGGTIGPGTQRVSWIHVTDFARAVDFLLAREDLDGAVNLVAPDALPNVAFMHALRRACGMPVGLPTPRWMLAIGSWLLRTESELVLKSRWVWPGRLRAAGFTFRFPALSGALADLCGSERSSTDWDATHQPVSAPPTPDPLSAPCPVLAEKVSVPPA